MLATSWSVIALSSQGLTDRSHRGEFASGRLNQFSNVHRLIDRARLRKGQFVQSKRFYLTGDAPVLGHLPNQQVEQLPSLDRGRAAKIVQPGRTEFDQIHEQVSDIRCQDGAENLVHSAFDQAIALYVVEPSRQYVRGMLVDPDDFGQSDGNGSVGRVSQIILNFRLLTAIGHERPRWFGFVDHVAGAVQDTICGREDWNDPSGFQILEDSDVCFDVDGSTALRIAMTGIDIRHALQNESCFDVRF